MNDVEGEIRRRAKSLAKQQYLAVDYYRIRRKLAIPLPVNDRSEINYPVRCFSSAYPWGIWLAWALEDRIETLGEFVERTSDIEVRHVVERDLRALAGWRSYRETDRPDLPFAHLVRALWVAVSRWTWLDDSLRKLLTQALERAVNDALPFSEQLFGQFECVQDVLSTPSPHLHLHNIPVIGTCALALAANSVRHPDAARLNERVALLFSAILELRQQGFTEGVSYDGYVLTFIADWLSTQSLSVGAKFVDHPSMDGMIDQVVHLGVPGRIFESAPLGDVEFSKMPFVWSAIAKLLAIKSRSAVAWALAKCEISSLRADALVALLGLREKECGIAAPQTCSPVQVNYALAMRTGFGRNDICVAVGLSKSPMGHVHCDNGSLVLGTRGRWWLDDPGYQQYLQTSERQFTVGGGAHNAPVIDKHAQVLKQPEVLAATRLDDSDDVQFAFLDLTACYPAKAGVGRVRRAVWLIGNEHLVVCDDLTLASGQSLTYHWHGHPDLFWCLREGSATLVSEDDPDRSLHIFSPQIDLNHADLLRLRGSRGQQTLSITLYPPNETTVWWVFSFAAERPGFSVSGRQLTIADRILRMDDRLPEICGPWLPLSRDEPLRVSAVRQGDTVTGRCEASHNYFQGDLEYAFYLMIDGERAQTAWYTPSPEACFTLSAGAEAGDLEVRGFVREKANPEKKLMRRVVVPPAGRVVN